MPGVLAAGDLRHGSVKRVASAVGEGSIAMQLVHTLSADAELRPEHSGGNGAASAARAEAAPG
jgi:thioredoxin reductase (NADPH)